MDSRVQAVAWGLLHCWDYLQTVVSLVAEVHRWPLVSQDCLVKLGCLDWPHSKETVAQAAVEVKQHY